MHHHLYDENFITKKPTHPLTYHCVDTQIALVFVQTHEPRRAPALGIVITSLLMVRLVSTR